VAAHSLLHGGNHGSIDQSRYTMILCRRSARWQLGLQLYRDPASKDQAFQERVGRQSVGTMYARGCHLAAGVKTNQVRGTIDVGFQASAEVMACRRYRYQICCRVDAGSAAAVPDSGEPDAPGLLPQHATVDINMINTGYRHLFHDLFGDHIAWCQLGKLVLSNHESLTA
jgi:hypothetical protein